MIIRKQILAKLFEAIGVAAVMIALVVGIYGDEWGELYLFLGGIGIFLIGRQIEKKYERQQQVSVE
jgi:hypothetical protein